MGLDKADAVSEPSSGKLERAPDSGPLGVSLNTKFESGIPPARLRQEFSLQGGVERMDLALENVARTEANLGLLIRGFKHLVAGALAARAANTELMQELDALRAHLSSRNEEEHALRFRMSQLEQLLDVIRHETTREREFLIEQQDLFLVQIMSEHERQIADLRRSIREANTRPHDARKPELTALCDQARDPVQLELVETRGVEQRRSSPEGGATAIGAINLRPAPAAASLAADPGPQRPSERPSAGTGYSLSRKDIAD